MTSKLFALFFFCLSALFVTAQTPNTVLETERMMSFGSRPCFRMEFANATPRMVEKAWEDFTKKNFSAKISKNKKNDEYVAPSLRASFMGSEPFTLYSSIDKVGNNGTGISVWFDQGTAFLSRSNNAARTDEAIRMLKQFYLDVRRIVVGQEVKAEEEKLKDLDSKYKKLQRDNTSMRKDIEEWKGKIKKTEDEILTNEKTQETTLADQETQRKAIEEARKRLQNVDTEIRQ
jgi:hypothetical protein